MVPTEHLEPFGGGSAVGRDRALPLEEGGFCNRRVVIRSGVSSSSSDDGSGVKEESEK